MIAVFFVVAENCLRTLKCYECRPQNPCGSFRGRTAIQYLSRKLACSVLENTTLKVIFTSHF
jgi:hypothetical protein